MKPRPVHSAIHALGRNLVAGLRLALFMPVSRASFRISALQLLLIVLLSAAIDIDADWVRAANDTRFSMLGLHGEIFALGLLALTSALIAILRRDGELYLALPIVVLASFPLIQVVHVLPDLPQANSAVSARTKAILEYAVLAWMFVIAIRAVYVCLDPIRRRRRAWAVAGGVLLIAPLWFAPLLGPLEPWWQQFDAMPSRADAVSPASEAVLAAQEFMLDRALDALEDERPGVTDLYFVGFAPDARRPGFAADVDAAQRTMDERWSTNGRSVVLLNSPLTVAERPFASITHLRKVLLEIGDVIDADDDVVMVYLTGASGPDHALAAVNPPLQLASLSAQGLRQLLDAAAIRWRIIVVSTCQAGAWIDALKDDETVVIASSAGDVRGGDCAGGIRPSSFGDAFFGVAMRRNDDLAHAFEAARRDLVEHRAAQPLMFVGPAIAEHLKSLRAKGSGRVVADASIGESHAVGLRAQTGIARLDEHRLSREYFKAPLERFVLQPLHRFGGVERQVRPQDHVVHRVQRGERMSGQRDRLGAIDVEPGARDRFRVERVYERLLVDDRAARNVDEYGVRLHAGEFAFADQLPGFGRQHRVDGDDVAPPEQCMKLVALVDAGMFHCVAIDERVVAEDVHPESAPRHARDVGTDPADADESERLAREVRRQPA